MGFPPDVRRLYTAPPRVVGEGPRGNPIKRSVTAYVYHNRIDFVANRSPEGQKDTKVQVFLQNDDPNGYDSNNPDEWQTGKNPSVKIDHSIGGVAKETPLTFTNQRTEIQYQPQGGGPPYPTPSFTFEYTIPLFGDGPWEFTKSGRSGGVKDWDTPLKDPKPVGDPDNPIVIDDPQDGGMDSNLIMLAVVLMVAAVVAVNM